MTPATRGGMQPPGSLHPRTRPPPPQRAAVASAALPRMHVCVAGRLWPTAYCTPPTLSNHLSGWSDHAITCQAGAITPSPVKLDRDHTGSPHRAITLDHLIEQSHWITSSSNHTGSPVRLQRWHADGSADDHDGATGAPQPRWATRVDEGTTHGRPEPRVFIIKTISISSLFNQHPQTLHPVKMRIRSLTPAPCGSCWAA